MKKLRYIQPETTVVRLRLSNHILNISENGNSVNLAEFGSENNGYGDGDDAAGRRHRNVWDDEYEEDEW